MINKKNYSWEDARDLLVEGNKRFIAKAETKIKTRDRRLNDKLEPLALIDGQAPFAIILGCADSRVAPEIIFDENLGELFVIRVAGNIANTSSIASIEYAVDHLNVNLIVVLGHEECGAVSAAIAGGDNKHNLNMLLAHITPAVVEERAEAEAKAKAEAEAEGKKVDCLCDIKLDKEAVVKRNACINATALCDRSEIIREKTLLKEKAERERKEAKEAGKSEAEINKIIIPKELKIIPAYYSIKSGKVVFLDKKCQEEEKEQA